MEFKEYSKTASQTINKTLDSRELLINACLGLSGEVGEITEHIKKHFYHGKELGKDYLEKEIGDVLWYLNELAVVIDSDLETCAVKNNIKLKERYGNEFSVEKSLNRKE